MVSTDALGAAAFFERIFKELWQSVYLALGGSLDDGLDWASRWTYFAGIGIKILVLLIIIGVIYWFLVYTAKHVRTFLGLPNKHTGVLRASLRYLWFVMSVLAVMSQIGMSTTTIKAVAKASAWAGLYYVMWAMSGQTVRWLLRQYDINESIEQLCRNLLSVLIVVLALATVMAQFGFDIVSIVAGLGIAGLAVGFAAQSTLANFIAGIAILIEQSFGVGDWIYVGTKEGKVVKITLRTTHILTRDNTIVIFPNSTVASSEVVNLTSKTFVRFDMPVRVALHTEIDKARSLILSVLKTHDAILTHPLATVTLDRIGEYDMFFVVRFWVAPVSVARLPVIKEQMLEQIKNTLDNANIKPPYPHMQLVQSDGQALDKRVLLPTDNVPTNKPIKKTPHQHNLLHQFPDGS